MNKLIAACAGAALLATSPLTLAADCAKEGTPQQIEGRVVKIDAGTNKITVKNSDGSTHVFQASPETLKDYKEGDTVKAKLRCPE
jgi:hypothetical protein